jgi:hypothetical protein
MLITRSVFHKADDLEFGTFRVINCSMKRRNFLKGTILTGSITALASTIVAADSGVTQKKKKQQFYELREYSFANKGQQELVEAYLEKAAIPALNRMGSDTVGVFREQDATGLPRLFVVIPFASLDKFNGMRETLFRDSVYQAAAADYIKATTAAPAYTRIISSLLRAFQYMPQLEAPARKERLLELRRYESHSELAHQKKIHMFSEGGEIDIFRRVGLAPVFFGETLIGERIPNLTYMLAFDDMAEHDKNWKLFSADPQWTRLKELPEYANTVTTITRTFLQPTSFSQI